MLVRAGQDLCLRENAVLEFRFISNPENLKKSKSRAS